MQNSKTSVYTPIIIDSDNDSLCYPGEYLFDVINRSLDSGVGIGQEVQVMYDEDGIDDVDPACDIRTDRFALAELSQHQRVMREEMQRQAELNQVTPEPSNPTPAPEPPATPPAE